MLDKSILEYTESFYEKHFGTKKEHEALIDKIKAFFAKIVSLLKDFSSSIKNKFDRFVRENSLELKLKKVQRQLIQKQLAGEKKVKSKDIQKYKKTYLKMVDELLTYSKKFQKMKYKSVNEIDRDLATFNRIKERYEKELDKIADKEIEVRIDEAIKTITAELNGTTEMFKTIDTCITKVREMEANAEKLELERNIANADVIPKKISLLQRVWNSITSAIRRGISKFLSVFVFLFAF